MIICLPGHLSPFCLWKGENALEGSRTTALCDVALAAVAQGCHASLVLCPCDACAKGELVHAEATSTSDLVFGISNFAAIELYQSYGCAYRHRPSTEIRMDMESLDTSTPQQPRQPRHKPRHLDTSHTWSQP